MVLNLDQARFFQNDIAGDIGHQEFLNYLSVNFFSCDLAKSPSNSRFQREELPCLLSQDSEIVDVALIGDSHAGHLLLGFIENLREVNVTYYPINRLPIVDEEDFFRVYDRVVADEALKTVFSNYWAGRFGEISVGSSLARE